MSRLEFIKNNVKLKKQANLEADNNKFLYFRIQEPIEDLAQKGITRNKILGLNVTFNNRVVGKVMNASFRPQDDLFELICRVDRQEHPEVSTLLEEGALSKIKAEGFSISIGR